jgi:hypothetical protein
VQGSDARPAAGSALLLLSLTLTIIVIRGAVTDHSSSRAGQVVGAPRRAVDDHDGALLTPPLAVGGDKHDDARMMALPPNGTGVRGRMRWAPATVTGDRYSWLPWLPWLM